MVTLEDPQASEARSEAKAASERAEPVDSPPNPLPILLVTGLLWGGLEALVLHGVLHQPWVWLLAGALATVPAGALGLAAWGLLKLLWRSKALRSRIGSAWRAATDRSAEDRGPIVTLHAQLSAGVLVVGGVAVVCWLVLSRLIVLQEQDLALHLAIFTTVSLVIGVLLAVPLGVRILTLVWRALDRRLRLPLPPQAGVRYLLFVALPVLPLVGWFLWAYDEFIGAIATVGSLLILCVSAPLVAYAVRVLFPFKLPRRRAAGWVVVALWPAWLVAAGVGYAYGPASAADAETGRAAALGADLLRTLSDVDRDGASSLLAGGDCAPFDRSRSPGVLDLPGNGIDEDCDGRDRPPMKGVVPSRQVSGKLTRTQIRKYNIVWVVIDAVRADHVPTFGYDKPTLPNLDALAKESLVFSQAYSQSSATNFSIPSMLIGKNPGAMRWEKKTNRLRPVLSEVKVAQRLKSLGYRTGIVLPNVNTLVNIQPGYDWIGSLIVEDEPISLWMRRGAPIAYARAVEFITEKAPDARARKPIFLTVYFPDPHAPYRRHADVETAAFATNEGGGYDSELRFCDDYLGLLVDFLKTRSRLWDETILIVTSDHGQEFGEHGGKRHAYTCYTESVHVPLFIRIPGFAPQRIDSPVALVDIVPTLLELTGGKLTGELHGQSLLVPALDGAADEPPRNILCSIVSQRTYRGKFFRRSVRSESLTLYQDVLRKRQALYDTSVDPGEQTDVADQPQHAAKLAELQAILAASRTGNLTAWKVFGR